MRLIRALRDCKQRRSTVSKKAPPVSKKASPLSEGSDPMLVTLGTVGPSGANPHTCSNRLSSASTGYNPSLGTTVLSQASSKCRLSKLHSTNHTSPLLLVVLATWHRGRSRRKPNRRESPNRRHFASLDLKFTPTLRIAGQYRNCDLRGSSDFFLHR